VTYWGPPIHNMGLCSRLGESVTVTYWGPPINNMGLCSRLGEDPKTWKHFGPEPIRAIVV